MLPSSPIDVVLKFEQLINTRSADSVCSLLTEDAVFIDSLGNRVEGLGLQRSAWMSYFNMIPDYSISHNDIFANGNTVVMLGIAQGTFSKDGKIKKENSWQSPASWRAVVRNGKIAVWQVFADNGPLREIMKRE